VSNAPMWSAVLYGGIRGVTNGWMLWSTLSSVEAEEAPDLSTILPDHRLLMVRLEIAASSPLQLSSRNRKRILLA
jgi:hypothetical protein